MNSCQKNHIIIDVDINGNNILGNIYFKRENCSKIIIEEQDQILFEIGCGKESNLKAMTSIDWVNLWCLVYDKQVNEVLFKENGDIDKDTTITLENHGIYMGKEEAGGGIITYKNHEFYWVHQSD